MPKDNENIQLPFIGPVTPTEPQGFTPDQMIRCDECLRANPPTRVSCFYCGCSLPVTKESQRLRKPVLRPPDKHQIGYNSIYLPSESSTVTAQAVETAAELLKISIEDFQKILSYKTPFPVARTASREDAELVHARITELGFSALLVSDSELMPQENGMVRVRALNMDQDGFTIIQSAVSDVSYFKWLDVVLIVTGRLLQKTVEVTERKSRKTENEIIASSEFHSDETIIDLYIRSMDQTWRIVETGFDFSCLENEKTLVANENIGRLLRLLTDKCSNAFFDDSYRTLRHLLQLAWPAERETTSRGWRRERPGQVNLAASSIESNDAQFNRYSRLRFRTLGG